MQRRHVPSLVAIETDRKLSSCRLKFVGTHLRNATSPILFGTALVLSAGCNGEVAPQPDQDPTDGDGLISTGEPGADETAGEGGAGYCIINDNAPDHLEGIRHQCSMEYDLDIQFELSSSIVGPTTIGLQNTGVQTASEPSTYEHPYVMACCSDIADNPDWPLMDSCATPHHRACVSDFIEHICTAPSAWLNSIADDYILSGREAIEAMATHLAKLEVRQDCYDHFWTGPDSIREADYCSSEFDTFFNFTPWHPSFSFTWDAEFFSFTASDLSVDPRAFIGDAVPLEPPADSKPCTLPDGNNGEIPPLSGPSGEFFLTPVGTVPIEVSGPKFKGEVIRGAGAFGPNSSLRWSHTQPGALEIEQWSMSEDASTVIGTSAFAVGVDGFKLDLLGGATAVPVGQGWKISAKSALFNIAATIEGTGASVHATNSADIFLGTIQGGFGTCPINAGSCVVTTGFSIDYEDETGGRWSTIIPSITWHP